MLKEPKRTRRLIPVLGLALVASLLLSGLAAASASAAEEHWHLCKEKAGGEYGAGCQAKTSGGYELIQQQQGVPLEFVSHNLTPIKLNYTIGTGKYTIECTTESGSGSVLNPTGGGAGTMTGNQSLLEFTKCKYNPAFGLCSVKEGRIRGYGSSGSTSDQSVFLQAAGGAVLMSFSATPCLGEMTITGTLTGSFNNTTSALDFDGTSGSGLKMSGVPVWIEGSIKLETTNKQPLFLK
jgi:hypothetical protein